ncbi:MAG: CDP-alcohol phosphatidyltransferase family protein, partial [Patescibacteria group bacterium]
MVDHKFADSIAKWFDLRNITPNQLTVQRIVLSFPMCLSFAFAKVYETAFWYWFFLHTCGVLLYTWCALCDFFDGALARYQKRRYALKEKTEAEEYRLPIWERLKIKGSSHYGAVLDPFSDKTLYFCALFPLGWSVVDPIYLWLSLCVALILTAIRFRAIRRALEFGGKGAANRFGKYK